MATNLSEISAIHHNELVEWHEEFGVDIRFLFEFGELFSSVGYLQAQRARRQIKEEFKTALTEVEVIMAPTLPVMPPTIGSPTADLNGEQVDLGAVPCLVDTLTLAQNGPENAGEHRPQEHLYR